MCLIIHAWRLFGGKNIGAAIRGEVAVQTALDNMAQQADTILAQLQKKGMGQCTPKLNAPQPPSFWHRQEGAPFAKLPNEKPKGETQSYENSLKY
jgi:glycerol transport system substrate-binding protein